MGKVVERGALLYRQIGWLLQSIESDGNIPILFDHVAGERCLMPIRAANAGRGRASLMKCERSVSLNRVSASDSQNHRDGFDKAQDSLQFGIT